MAQLKDTIISGNLSISGSAQATKFIGPLEGSASKVNNALTITVNDTTTTYDGSSAKSLTITVPTDTDTTYTFASGSNGSFSVTPSGGTAQGVSIGKPSTAGTADYLQSIDTRSVNSAPTDYLTNRGKKLIFEFKYKNVIGISEDNTYGSLLTLTSWGNNTSGGYPIQIAGDNNSGTLFTRYGTSETDWSDWKQFAFTDTAVSASQLPTSGVTAASYGPSANASPSHSGTFNVPYFTVDTYGRITAASTKTITLPSDSDTKNTAGASASTSKLYLIGAASQGTNPQTYSNANVYATNGALTANSFNVTTAATMSYNSNAGCIEFTFV